jgi:hypothetical protein
VGRCSDNSWGDVRNNTIIESIFSLYRRIAKCVRRKKENISNLGNFTIEKHFTGIYGERECVCVSELHVVRQSTSDI